MVRNRSARAVLLACLLLPALAGCSRRATEAPPRPENPRYRLAFAQLSQETNSFSPVPTTLRDFEATGLYRGGELPAAAVREGEALAGFLAAVGELGRGEIEAVPILKADAVSGGPVQRETYERLKSELLDGLRQAGRLDGVYLCLHGAMGVEGLRDPEGDLLAGVRDALGPDVPVGVSFDLHANVTAARARLATFIVGYKTNPHRDFYRVGRSSGELLVRTARGEVRPVMAVRKMRLLKGGGMNIDFLPPMRRIFRAMKGMERRDGVLSVSNFMVHVWLDDPELGWSTVAVADGDAALAARTAEELADLDWAVRGAAHPEPLSAPEAVREVRASWLARKTGTVVICDVADAVGAGGPGENTWILKSLLEEGPDLVSYVPVRDEAAAGVACAAGVGRVVTLNVGGKLDAVYNRPLCFTGEVVYAGESPLGRTAVVRDRGVHLIVTELPATARSPRFFQDLGLGLWKADVVVVKNLFPFRFTYWLTNRRTIDVLTPGTTSVDVFGLGYRTIPRPIYPLDPVESWRE